MVDIMAEMAKILTWIEDPEVDYPDYMARHDLCELVDQYYDERGLDSLI